MRDALEIVREELDLNIGVGEVNPISWLEDKFFKEWRKDTFVLGGELPIWGYLMRGMSCLFALYTSSTERKLEAQDAEQRYQETASTRNEDQVARMQRSDPQCPLKNWNQLKYRHY